MTIRQSTSSEPLLNIERIGVYARDKEAVAAADRLKRVLGKTNIELRMLECETVEGIAEGCEARSENWKPDVLLAMGGDGTVLRALCQYPTVPVLAVNFGTTGFLTAGDSKDLSHIIFRLLEGDYYLEERTLLTSRYNGAEFDVINEVVVKGTTKMVTLKLSVDGTHVHTLRGNGFIVGTPTGSTGYLMSAGSSIVMPTVDVMILSGINEYRFSSRSLVIDIRSHVEIEVDGSTRDDKIYLLHDGRDPIPLKPGNKIAVRRSEKSARLIFFDRHAFFKNLKERLDW